MDLTKDRKFILVDLEHDRSFNKSGGEESETKTRPHIRAMQAWRLNQMLIVKTACWSYWRLRTKYYSQKKS